MAARVDALQVEEHADQEGARADGVHRLVLEHLGIDDQLPRLQQKHGYESLRMACIA